MTALDAAISSAVEASSLKPHCTPENEADNGPRSTTHALFFLIFVPIRSNFRTVPVGNRFM
jgi:hypothetical protein